MLTALRARVRAYWHRPDPTAEALAAIAALTARVAQLETHAAEVSRAIVLLSGVLASQTTQQATTLRLLADIIQTIHTALTPDPGVSRSAPTTH